MDYQHWSTSIYHAEDYLEILWTIKDHEFAFPPFAQREGLSATATGTTTWIGTMKNETEAVAAAECNHRDDQREAWSRDDCYSSRCPLQPCILATKQGVG